MNDVLLVILYQVLRTSSTDVGHAMTKMLYSLPGSLMAQHRHRSSFGSRSVIMENDDDSEFAVSRGGRVPRRLDDDEFAVASVARPARAAAKAVAQRRHTGPLPLRTKSSSPLCVFLVIDPGMSDTAFVKHMFAKMIDAEPHYTGVSMHVICGIVFIDWCLRPASEPARTDCLAELQARAVRQRRWIGNVPGYTLFFL